MAYQHFYSRVPARISLYNKTDGFDTFAHSAALSDEFILREISPIYTDKLRGFDVGSVRRGEISPIYFQKPVPTGGVVQSALSFIPRDYTGERSAYLVHSLVLDTAEQARIFDDRGAYVFNPDMFITDISLFNVTASNAAPNRNYPPIGYVPKKFTSLKRIVSRLAPELMQKFIYAVIMCACGEGRNVLFRLPSEDADVSRDALELISSVMAIMPYSFREKLSFVTYVTDPTQHEEFNIKCVSRSCRDVPLSKGIFFDFEENIVKGVSDEELRANKPLIGFFYMLFDNENLRNRFHDYVMSVTATYGSDTLELKTLSELVFLFWQCSGFYTERSVLPNDAMVYEFFSIFERYQDALSTEYRTRAYRCLERYPREHLPIPENVFAKLESVYPLENTEARRVALDVVLSLIHTDAMRGKLFAFIKNNYQDELPDVKRVINEDLCRVFYGGFLQSELLDFFDANFRLEPAETKAIIVEKMLLAIRTATIQKKIVAILNRNYDALSSDLRAKVYNTFFEMLSECDTLASLLVDLVNSNVVKEKSEFRSKVAETVLGYLDFAYRRKNRRLLPILIEKDGFCEDVVIRSIFTRPVSEELYSDYIHYLASSNKRNKATKLVHIFRVVPEMGERVYESLLGDCRSAFGDVAWSTLYDLISADRIASVSLPPRPLAVFREIIVYPAMVSSIYDVFKVRFGKDGIRILKSYAAGKSYVTESEPYKTVEEYVAMVDAALKGETEAVFVHLTRLPADPAIRRDISEHVRMCSLNKNEQSEKTALLFELVINALKDSGFRFDAVFTQYRNYIINRKKIEFGKSESPEKLMRDSTAEATALVIEIATEICYAHPDYIDLVCSETSGISKVISSFVPIYGLGSGRFIKECLANSPKELQNLASYAFKEGKAELPTAKERAVKIGTDIKDRAEKISSGIKEQVDKIFKK